MRILLSLALFTLLLPALATPAAAAHNGSPDGITARITPAYAIGELVLFPDASGAYPVQVEVWRDVGGVWQRVVLQNTLRACWFDAATQAEVCPVFVPVTSSASGPVTVSIPKGALPQQTLIDLFVTFSQIGTPAGTPTSHHSVMKNILIAMGNPGAADTLDGHQPSRVIAL